MSKFKNHSIGGTIQKKKSFAKFMIPISLFEKFIATVEVSNMARCSNKSDE